LKFPEPTDLFRDFDLDCVLPGLLPPPPVSIINSLFSFIPLLKWSQRGCHWLPFSWHGLISFFFFFLLRSFWYFYILHIYWPRSSRSFSLDTLWEVLSILWIARSQAQLSSLASGFYFPISITQGQLYSENIKWKITEIIPEF
jgi:hypothetical protein